jgi:hypothetical protein
MKLKSLSRFAALPVLVIALSVQAHDPKEHRQDAEKPDCKAMKDMDHSKMDMNDPVMKAMMQKCMKDMHHDEEEEASDSSTPNEDHGKHGQDNKKPSEHQH